MRFANALVALALASTTPATALSFFGDDQKVVANEALAVPGDSPLLFCDKPHDEDLAQIERVDLVPNPPLAGQNLSIVAKGTVLETIEEGAYVKLIVKYGLIRLLNIVADLCKEIKNVDLDCPIEKGDLEITKQIELPSQIPPGKYNVFADVYDKNDKPITCLTATVVFSRQNKGAMLDDL